jgi:hypothetical protein
LESKIVTNEKHSFSNQHYSKLPAFKRLEALKKLNLSLKHIITTPSFRHPSKGGEVV